MLFFGVSLLPEINSTDVNRDIYESAGFPLAAVLVFLLSAAGLGASFSSLFDAYELVAEGRYDTRYDSLYWARIGLGLISGLMLSELVPQRRKRTGPHPAAARPPWRLLIVGRPPDPAAVRRDPGEPSPGPGRWTRR